MKKINLILLIFTWLFILASTGVAQRISSNCDARGRIAGIYHTSCFLWLAADGNISVSGTLVKNDTPRLKYIFEDSTRTSEYGKIVFDEPAYYINDSIRLHSFRTLTGTGRAALSDPNDINNPINIGTSRIIQMGNNKAVFFIGGSVQDVAIRDIALIGGPGTSGTIGIKAENGDNKDSSYQSVNFDFSNITFSNFYRGIYVNSRSYNPGANPSPGEGSEGYWRFENAKLDHLIFEGCKIGVHYNSNNSGLSMKNVLFYVLNGDNLPEIDGEPQPVTTSNIDSFTMGVYLQRVGYATLDLLIADGEGATAFIYVGQHSNLNIKSSIEENFKNSIVVYGGDTNSPVTIINNSIQSLLTIRNSTVVSTGNQFTSQSNATNSLARAVQSSTVYSIGDKFCFDIAGALCTETNREEYVTDQSSQVVFSANKYRNTMSKLRIGRFPYHFDIARNENTGILEFNASQGTGTGGGHIPGFAGYSFATNGGIVKINYDGSVSYGSKNYNELINFVNLLNIPSNGTVIYCSDCQKSTPCSSGGTGALAKRINSSWDCN